MCLKFHSKLFTTHSSFFVNSGKQMNQEEYRLYFTLNDMVI